MGDRDSDPLAPRTHGQEKKDARLCREQETRKAQPGDRLGAILVGSRCWVHAEATNREMKPGGPAKVPPGNGKKVRNRPDQAGEAGKAGGGFIAVSR